MSKWSCTVDALATYTAKNINQHRPIMTRNADVGLLARSADTGAKKGSGTGEIMPEMFNALHMGFSRTDEAHR